MEPDRSHHNGAAVLVGVPLGDGSGVTGGRQPTTMTVYEARSPAEGPGQGSRAPSPGCGAWCQAPGCGSPARTRGYCPRHYQQVRKFGRLTPEREYYHREAWCSVEGCRDLQVAKGYCYRHYQQIRRHGQLTPERERVYGRTGCQVPECQNAHFARGHCQKHYARCYYASRRTVAETSQPAGSAMAAFADTAPAPGADLRIPTSRVPGAPILYAADEELQPCPSVPKGAPRWGTA
jgi:hypothetical protein